jgi:hypothetical protein
MLCESLFHILVEQGVISQEEALEAIGGVADLAEEMTERSSQSHRANAALILIETIRDSFALMDKRTKRHTGG